MPGFHPDEEILFTWLAAPLPSLSCSLRNSLIFLLLSLACHASLWLLLFLTVPVVYSSCLQGVTPCGFFLFCLPSTSSHLPADFSARSCVEGTVWGGEVLTHPPESLLEAELSPSRVHPSAALPSTRFLRFSLCRYANLHLSGQPQQPQLSLPPRTWAQEGWRAPQATA